MWKKRANNRLAGKILHADASELEGIRTAVMERYQKLYPDWEIIISGDTEA